MAKKPDNSGRDNRGRFAKGNRGGPGRMPRVVEQDYLATLQANCTPEVWARIVHKAIERALDGDMKAVDWLGKYVMPPPEQRLRLSGDTGLRIAGTDPSAVTQEFCERLGAKMAEQAAYREQQRL